MIWLCKYFGGIFFRNTGKFESDLQLNLSEPSFAVNADQQWTPARDHGRCEGFSQFQTVDGL